MNRAQRAAAFINVNTGVTRDEFQRTFNVALLDALHNNGYVARSCDVYTVTESGHRFINDNEASP